MACFDIHERRQDGSVGKLLDVIDRTPERRKSGLFIEFDGEMFQVLTGIRNFITVTTERWAQVSGR
ncbi:hypothetical protein [Pseudomonas costantinii]|uniref:Uncharacterized protein n=1 Tax=Pseudomonas costantinii TaxID=168469 RepID=A0A1S2V2F4_9PSED|nr:hypothetical protein [Pseudomonas costantinii]OIN52914.1 hypothetical protein BFL40_12495 [Pseudomonas costantinii]SED27953.1 hypothetical protein SAMN04515675_0542 [Pseudomonas costantinii]